MKLVSTMPSEEEEDEVNRERVRCETSKVGRGGNTQGQVCKAALAREGNLKGSYRFAQGVKRK